LSEFKELESVEPNGLYRLIEEAKANQLRRAAELHDGGLGRNADTDKRAEQVNGGKSGAAKPPAARHAAPMGAFGLTMPAAPGSGLAAGFGGLPRPSPGGGAAPSSFRDVASAERKPVAPTPDPKPPAELEPVPTPTPPIAPTAADAAAAPPVAVHLGSMHPVWITAADGSETLVVVRTARVENKKTVYQGVVLDWNQLQSALKEEVKDLFPEARLAPLKDLGGSSREEAMTALPIRLDPGPSPEPPPAGWTPLRIGLVLAWIAAAIAVTAVGFSGWSLIDLAERRIRFVSAVTHELRTPLTSLRLYLDLLLSGMVQDEEKRREYLSTLNVESDRLHRLIDNVLDYARLERRRKGRTLNAMSIADFLEQTRRTWSDRVAADGKELVILSAIQPEQDLVTDESLLQQIVGNLIDNARKYTREATDARIWLRARMDGPKRVVFEVEDRGPGVSPRDQKMVFRPFRRGETADAKAGGAGLGLALSKDWAEILGGKLTLRSAEGGTGACFRLELPAT
jgi:signal transduction histidine kinase